MSTFPHRTLIACLSLLIAWFVVPLDTLLGESPSKPQAGWPDLFVRIDGYSRDFKELVVEPGEKPRKYHQKVSYVWMGGRFEEVDVTMAHDAAFKEKYSAEAMKKDKNLLKELQINKKQAWMWEFSNVTDKFKDVARRLVIVLDTDKVIIVEQRGYGLDLQDVAKKFDFAKIEKVLESPPMK